MTRNLMRFTETWLTATTQTTALAAAEESRTQIRRGVGTLQETVAHLPGLGKSMFTEHEQRAAPAHVLARGHRRRLQRPPFI